MAKRAGARTRTHVTESTPVGRVRVWRDGEDFRKVVKCTPPKKGFITVTLRGNCRVRLNHDNVQTHILHNDEMENEAHRKTVFYYWKMQFFILTVFGMFPFFHDRLSFKMKKNLK